MNHRSGQSTFSFSLENAYAWIACGVGSTYLCGPISAAIVHDNKFAIHRYIGDGGTQALQKNRNISCFIEGRYYQA
jgi:hypothetical protein